MVRRYERIFKSSNSISDNVPVQPNRYLALFRLLKISINTVALAPWTSSTINPSNNFNLSILFFNDCHVDIIISLSHSFVFDQTSPN